ncbi:hypothetical protein PTTG_25683 [Puccinia triticina 1-1 BBBD Race 1]|uniref:Uncharacterized protein n=1 Tax=Puccinia triticina (isolate 1-1 / race 1 (BBBD)) TaxID=630390 RepID=A0A180H2D3_PUCT1|nr:hypothetical protein PTTG_25683 [Puccinia triticina 1-1 BBBD Race 1]
MNINQLVFAVIFGCSFLVDHGIAPQGESGLPEAAELVGASSSVPHADAELPRSGVRKLQEIIPTTSQDCSITPTRDHSTGPRRVSPERRSRYESKVTEKHFLKSQKVQRAMVDILVNNPEWLSLSVLEKVEEVAPNIEDELTLREDEQSLESAKLIFKHDRELLSSKAQEQVAPAAWASGKMYYLTLQQIQASVAVEALVKHLPPLKKPLTQQIKNWLCMKPNARTIDDETLHPALLAVVTQRSSRLNDQARTLAAEKGVDISLAFEDFFYKGPDTAKMTKALDLVSNAYPGLIVNPAKQTKIGPLPDRGIKFLAHWPAELTLPATPLLAPRALLTSTITSPWLLTTWIGPVLGAWFLSKGASRYRTIYLVFGIAVPVCASLLVLVLWLEWRKLNSGTPPPPPARARRIALSSDRDPEDHLGGVWYPILYNSHFSSTRLRYEAWEQLDSVGLVLLPAACRLLGR